MYGTVAIVSADNPASNCLGGFKESSVAYHPCRQCMTIFYSMHGHYIFSLMFDEDKFQIRDKQTHGKQ